MAPSAAVVRYSSTQKHEDTLLLTAKPANTEMTIQGTDRTNCISSYIICCVATEE